MKVETMELLFGEARRMSSQPAQNIGTGINLTAAQAEGERLVVGFEFRATYQPDQSYMVIGGRAAFSGLDAAKAAQEWAKTGRIAGPEGEFILNAVNYSAAINGVLLARAFNLTPPLMLPTLTFESAGKKGTTPRKK
ncbi:MAG: hypothetical protein AB1324_03525 [Candidatus Micrarchaeota archaeon]